MITVRDIKQVCRGLLMGGADIIPGVSGGTVALILGIYDRLITAISNFDIELLGFLTKKQWRAAAKHIDLQFLLFLVVGIGTGVISLARLMHYLLDYQLQDTLAVFFGLILGSTVLVGRMVKGWNVRAVVAAVAGCLFAFFLVGVQGLKNPPDSNLYVFLCGTIAICAMILPGISGSFILLIMGKYYAITGIIKGIPQGELSLESLQTLAIFAAGAIVGLLGFSKFLHWLLAHFQSATMAVLCGFMVGSLRRIWPFKDDLTPSQTKFAMKEFENIWPDFSNNDVWMSLLLLVLATVFVIVLEWVAGKSDSGSQTESK